MISNLTYGLILLFETLKNELAQPILYNALYTVQGEIHWHWYACYTNEWGTCNIFCSSTLIRIYINNDELYSYIENLKAK